MSLPVERDMSPDELRQARAALGMTQTQLADILGMTRRSISRMEHGVQTIEARTALAVRYLLQRYCNSIIATARSPGARFKEAFPRGPAARD